MAEVLPGERVHVVELPPGLSVAAGNRRFEGAPGIRFAEPDYVVEPSGAAVATRVEPNDPGYRQLWGLGNTGQTGGVSGADIDAPGAWEVTTGSAGAPVAVLDTGVDLTHPDLRANAWTNAGEVAGNGVDDDRNGYVDDVNGWDFYHGDNSVYDGSEDDHGTHVAGTIAATGGNGTGVTGVNWRARIMPLKFLGPDGGLTSDAIAALDYAVANGARVSNNSWGGPGESQALSEAITRADQAGHLLVAAAGNGGDDGIGDDNDAQPDYPASYPQDNVLAVAATDDTDDTDTLATFSNFGATSVDLAAPGVDIVSTVTAGAYGSYSGTSMASPHVAGAAALLLAADPTRSTIEVRQRLLETVDALPALASGTTTGGRLDVGAAMARAEAAASTLTAAASPTTIRFTAATGVTGSLSAGGALLAGETVTVQARPVGTAAWRNVANVTTDATGRFQAPGLRPDRHTDYRADYARSTGPAQAATSTVRRVSVRVLVTLAVDTRDLRRGGTRVLTGVVRPVHRGTVQLTITRNGTVVARRDLSLTESRYRFSYTPPRAGDYAFTVRRAFDADHLGAASPTRRFRVVP